jgi:hypothetical protein
MGIMFIKAISWINKDIQEAEVLVSDNFFELLCFSQPLKKHIDEEFKEPIYCFGVSDVMLSTERTSYVKKKDDAYGYFLRGEVLNRNDQIVRLGYIELCLDDCYIPNDIKNGEYIEFNVSRLNIY